MVMNWWQRLFRSRQLEQELDKELQFHVDRQTADNRSAGMSEQDARRTTRLAFGGIPQVKEDCRESRGTLWVSSVAQDIRFTLRTLGRDRGFTTVAVLILALGIGANIVVFSVVNTLLLRPLPFHDAQQLVWITGNNGEGGLSDTAYRVDWWQAYKRSNQTMQNVTGFVPYLSIGETKLMNYGDPRPINGVWVLDDFFQTLGVQPALGRLFTHEEGVKGGRPALLLAYSFWKTQFHSDPNILGQSITLGKNAYTIIGVMPETFDFGAVFAPGNKMDYFIPAIPENMANWGHVLALVGRMKPGVTVAQARSEANTLFPHLRSTLKLDGDTDYKTHVLSLKDEVSGKLRRSLIVLWCAVGLILLIVCVNLSNLLLARAASRSREFGLRVALGARRSRLVRQLLTESLVLSGVGALLGLVFAYAATRWLAHQGSVALPLMSSIRVDQTALAWTVALAVAVGLLFGIVPGLKMSAGNLQETLKDSGHGTSDGRRHERMRSLLVISEVALACVLLVGAGLLLRSFLQVMRVDLGFRPDQASAMRMDTEPNYDDNSKGGEERGVVFREAIRQISALPGVEAVGITDSLPLEKGRSWDLHAVGRPTKPGENLDAFVYIATPGLLGTLGIHLREGRDFTWADTPKSQPVIIINQTAARREWPNQNPIGKLARGIGDGETRVVGVIDDVRDTSAEAPSSPEVYVPVTQGEPVKAEVIVRSALPTSVLAPDVMRILRSLNPQQAAVELRPIQTMVDHATSPRRFFAMLVGIFAALGLLLASLGIYGVISYSVTQQTQEIGIRMALGATREQVHRRVIWNTLRMTLVGVAIGTLASFAVARAIATLLFGTGPTDPLTFAGMILLLLAVAFLAGYLPARRASRIDPLVALRCN
jgi:predicted permease